MFADDDPYKSHLFICLMPLVLGIGCGCAHFVVAYMIVKEKPNYIRFHSSMGMLMMTIFCPVTLGMLSPMQRTPNPIPNDEFLVHAYPSVLANFEDPTYIKMVITSILSFMLFPFFFFLKAVFAAKAYTSIVFESFGRSDLVAVTGGDDKRKSLMSLPDWSICASLNTVAQLRPSTVSGLGASGGKKQRASLSHMDEEDALAAATAMNRGNSPGTGILVASGGKPVSGLGKGPPKRQSTFAKLTASMKFGMQEQNARRASLKRKMQEDLRKADTQVKAFLSKYSFLFLRFRPERHRFAVILLGRNILVAMTPLFGDSTSTKLILMAMLFPLYLVWLLLEMPFREYSINYLDMIGTACCIILLVVGGYTAEAGVSSSSSGYGAGGSINAAGGSANPNNASNKDTVQDDVWLNFVGGAVVVAGLVYILLYVVLAGDAGKILGYEHGRRSSLTDFVDVHITFDQEKSHEKAVYVQELLERKFGLRCRLAASGIGGGKAASEAASMNAYQIIYRTQHVLILLEEDAAGIFNFSLLSDIAAAYQSSIEVSVLLFGNPNLAYKHQLVNPIEIKKNPQMNIDQASAIIRAKLDPQTEEPVAPPHLLRKISLHLSNDHKAFFDARRVSVQQIADACSCTYDPSKVLVFDAFNIVSIYQKGEGLVTSSSNEDDNQNINTESQRVFALKRMGSAADNMGLLNYSDDQNISVRQQTLRKTRMEAALPTGSTLMQAARGESFAQILEHQCEDLYAAVKPPVDFWHKNKELARNLEVKQKASLTSEGSGGSSRGSSSGELLLTPKSRKTYMANAKIGSLTTKSIFDGTSIGIVGDVLDASALAAMQTLQLLLNANQVPDVGILFEYCSKFGYGGGDFSFNKDNSHVVSHENEHNAVYENDSNDSPRNSHYAGSGLRNRNSGRSSPRMPSKIDSKSSNSSRVTVYSAATEGYSTTDYNNQFLQAIMEGEDNASIASLAPREEGKTHQQDTVPKEGRHCMPKTSMIDQEDLLHASASGEIMPDSSISIQALGGNDARFDDVDLKFEDSVETTEQFLAAMEEADKKKNETPLGIGGPSLGPPAITMSGPSPISMSGSQLTVSTNKMQLATNGINLKSEKEEETIKALLRDSTEMLERADLLIVCLSKRVFENKAVSGLMENLVARMSSGNVARISKTARVLFVQMVDMTNDGDLLTHVRNIDMKCGISHLLGTSDKMMFSINSSNNARERDALGISAQVKHILGRVNIQEVLAKRGGAAVLHKFL